MNVNHTSAESDTFCDRLKEQGFVVNSDSKSAAVLLNEISLSSSSLRPGRYIFSGPLELRNHPTRNTPYFRAKAEAQVVIDDIEYAVVDTFTITSLVSPFSICHVDNKVVTGDLLLKRKEYADLKLINKKERFIEEFVLGREIEIIESSKANMVVWRWSAPVVQGVI